jgi:hypothetical protein
VGLKNGIDGKMRVIWMSTFPKNVGEEIRVVWGGGGDQNYRIFVVGNERGVTNSKKLYGLKMRVVRVSNFPKICIGGDQSYMGDLRF